MEIDLAEFVSDYLACDGDEPATARGIAIQYLDATLDVAEVHDDNEFERRVEDLVPNVEYYMG